MKHRTLSRLSAGLLLACSVATGAHASPVDAIYVFGDSLSDTGNVFAGTGGAEPAAPYVGGRFSNGPIWVDYLAQHLKLGPVVPVFQGGTDYAFGGATTGYPATISPGVPVPTLVDQVGLFLSVVGSAPSSALYSVWIGSNDVLNIIGNGVTGNTAVLQAQGAAQTEAGAIAALAAAGGRNFLVPLVTDLGVTPSLTQFGPLAAAAGTALSLVYDSALEADLAGLASAPGIDLKFFDTFTLLDEVVAFPAAFGFTDATDPCYIGLYTGGGSVCATPDQYLFWDELHPTTAAQAIIGQAAFNALPEPSTALLLGVGVVALAWRRRVVSR